MSLTIFKRHNTFIPIVPYCLLIFMGKTCVLNNRKISTDDYNVFRRGIQETYGSLYGRIDEHLGKALRHYGQHLIDGDNDHLEHIDTKSRAGKHQRQKDNSTPLFGGQGITGTDTDDNNGEKSDH